MYGDLLSKYPVVSGSVWKFEKGKLVCGSSLSGVNWLHIPQVSSVYMDPPWNNGYMKLFYQFANRKVEKTHIDYLVETFRYIKTKMMENSTVCFDMGVSSTMFLIERLQELGWKNQFVFTTYYGTSQRACNTVCGSFYNNYIGNIQRIEGKHGAEVTSGVVKSFIEVGHKTMLDPCCGKLDFLVEGLKQGMDNVYGIELIPEKLALGLERLEKLGYKVERLI